MLSVNNAVLGHAQQETSGPATMYDVASVVAVAFTAIAYHLQINEQAHPQTVCPIPKTADMAVAMHLVGTEAMHRLAPERMRTDMITIPRELFSDMTETLAALRLGIVNEAYKQQVDKYVFRAEELLTE